MPLELQAKLTNLRADSFVLVGEYQRCMDGFGWDMGGKPRAGGDGRGNGRSAHSGAGCVTKDGFGRNTGGELG